MSIFNKVLASVGIGNAKVDTKLSDSTFMVGEMISGVTEVVGGNTSQSVESRFIQPMSVKRMTKSIRIQLRFIHTKLLNRLRLVNKRKKNLLFLLICH